MLTDTIDLKTVFDSIDEMILIVDDNKKIIWCNNSAKETFGINEIESNSLSSDKIFDDNYVERIIADLSSGKFIGSNDMVLTNKNGDEINVLVNTKRILLNGKNNFVFIIKNVTGEKKEHLDLLRFSNAINKAVNPIQITDENGLMVYVNPAFEQTSGYTKDELIGKNPKILSSHKMPKEFWQKVWNKILSGKVWSGQIENKRKDGAPFYADSIISPITDDNEKIAGFLAVHKIITDLRLLEQHLVCAQRLGSMGTLAAGIAHEIGNPLTSISSIAQIMERATEDVFLKEKLVGIKRQINRIANIIRQLIEFSHPTISSPKSTGINRLIISAANMVKLGTQNPNIEFEVELGINLPKITVVAEDIIQVVVNILLNSVESIENSEGKIEIRSLEENNNIEIIITDNGKGISKENLSRIFEPFFSTKSQSTSVGLGLWVSYGIIRNLGGDILVESTIDEGSKFVIIIPIVE